MKVQPIYNNKIFKKGLEFASDNGALFVATTSLVLSAIARPIAIMSTPKTDKENRKYATAKSLASSAVGYGLMLVTSLPLAKSIKKINPAKYLKDKTIKTLQAGEKSLDKSKKYKFATQLFKLGLGFLIAVPKSIMTCAMIPTIVEKMFNSGKLKEENGKLNNFQLSTFNFQHDNNSPNFTGATDKLSKGIGKIIDTSFIKKLTEKFHNTNFEMHIMALTDTLATGTFVAQTSKSKKIDDDRKKALMYNAGISTGLSILCGYTIDKLTKKPTEKFIKRFKEANKNSLKLDKYVEGIKIVKPAFILGSLYYIVIPLISTFLADRFDKNLYKSNSTLIK